MQVIGSCCGTSHCLLGSLLQTFLVLQRVLASWRCFQTFNMRDRSLSQCFAAIMFCIIFLCCMRFVTACSRPRTPQRHIRPKTAGARDDDRAHQPAGRSQRLTCFFPSIAQLEQQARTFWQQQHAHGSDDMQQCVGNRGLSIECWLGFCRSGLSRQPYVLQ